ncbi:MAG: hypothetical protein Q7R35_15125 [Elusimicrobiota bacterium]|nr:hypothetical protein [Elusimicrobiota bacterium]
MSYLFIFTRLTLRAVFSSVYYYLTVAVMTALFFMLVLKLGPLLADKAAAELVAGQLVYTLLSTGMLLIFMCAQPVFVSEKQQNTILPLLYSPACAGEILAGKCLGLIIAALLGSAAALLVPLAAYPVMLKALLSLKIAAALGIIFGIVLSYTLIIGMLLLCFQNIKVLYPVLFFLNYVPMALLKYTKAYMEANGLGGANWTHFLSLCFLLLVSAGIYRFYFSKHRIVASI